MAKEHNLLLSVVVPVYNEDAGLADFHKLLVNSLKPLTSDYEIIYCDDGSTDTTPKLIKDWRTDNPKVKLLALSRNFGKEIATTAGINRASGKAIITIDADGQHPPALISKFVERWQAGSKVVIGLRTKNTHEGFTKHYGSRIFYILFNRLTGIKLVAGASDFRLIDRSVQRQFKRMTERNRITRGLIDWLGYKSDYVEFNAPARLAGEPGYSFRKLLKLAVDSIISLSISPLYITAYIGAVVLPVSVLIGLGMLVNAVFGDPLSLHATGSAYAIVFLMFLVGVLLVSQGIIGLYLSHIHTEAQNRPLYVVDESKSVGLDES